MYRKSTLRRMLPKTREIGRLLNELESVHRRLTNRLDAIQTMEADSRALSKSMEAQRERS